MEHKRKLTDVEAWGEMVSTKKRKREIKPKVSLREEKSAECPKAIENFERLKGIKKSKWCEGGPRGPDR